MTYDGFKSHIIMTGVLQIFFDNNVRVKKSRLEQVFRINGTDNIRQRLEIMYQ